MIKAKDILSLFLKYDKVVFSRYAKMTRPAVYHKDENIPRVDFTEALKEAQNTVDWEIKCSRKNKDGYMYNFPSYKFYQGKEGWEKHNIFSYIPLYKHAKWTKKSIEKYKGCIVWTLLFEYGDFIFDENLLTQLDNYIPWEDVSTPSRHNPYYKNACTINYGTTINQFDKIGFLSNDFIISHIKTFDCEEFFTKGFFELSIELFDKLYEYKNSDFYHAERVPPVIDYSDPLFRGINFDNDDNVNNTRPINTWISCISKNRRVKITYEVVWHIANTPNVTNWDLLLPNMIDLTPEKLWNFYKLKPDCIEVFIQTDFTKRITTLSLILQNANLTKSLDTFFLKILYQGGTTLPYPYKCPKIRIDSVFTYDFSVNSIKKHIAEWNEQICEYFDHMQRTPDTNYHYYKRVTTWDVLGEQETILLTYDLCRYLMHKNVKIGGGVILADGHCITNDMPNDCDVTVINGLSLFQERKVKDGEIDKILDDFELVEFFFKIAEFKRGYSYYKVNEIIDVLISRFFAMYPFVEYRNLLNICNKTE